MKSILKRRGRLVLVAAVVAVLATVSGLSVKGASAAKRSTSVWFFNVSIGNL